MFRFVLCPSRTAGQPASGVKVPNLCMNLAETGSHETQATEDKLSGHRGRKARFRVTLGNRSEEHTSELQSHLNLVCRLLLEKKKNKHKPRTKQKGTHKNNTP